MYTQNCTYQDSGLSIIMKMRLDDLLIYHLITYGIQGRRKKLLYFQFILLN